MYPSAWYGLICSVITSEHRATIITWPSTSVGARYKVPGEPPLETDGYWYCRLTIVVTYIFLTGSKVKDSFPIAIISLSLTMITIC